MGESVSFTAGVAPGIDDMFDLLSFTAGVAPGIDDNAVLFFLRVENKGSSGSFGKLSVYNTLALLLHKPTDVIIISPRERENRITSVRHPKREI
jgi:hypothetical protein